MDGKFVPAKTYTPEQLKQVKECCALITDVHFMVEDLPVYIDAYACHKPNIITFHIESTTEPQAMIDKIKGYGIKVGMTLKPGTSLDEIKPYLAQLDLVLVMTVEPGKGGQTFMFDQVYKIEELDELRKENGYKYEIQVDGGINGETGKVAIKAGADVLVSGSYIFKSDDYKKAMGENRNPIFVLHRLCI